MEPVIAMAGKKAPTWRKMPKDILQVMQSLQKSVSRLGKIGQKDGLKRAFTLDGRLVGDVGELLVARHYQIVPHKKTKGHVHDLYGMVGKKELGVQVKLRRASPKSSSIEFKSIPQMLVVIECSPDWSLWRIVYHGSGKVLNSYHKKMSLSELDAENNKNQWISLRLSKLKT
jgi:hypothetical protein